MTLSEQEMVLWRQRIVENAKHLLEENFQGQAGWRACSRRYYERYLRSRLRIVEHNANPWLPHPDEAGEFVFQMTEDQARQFIRGEAPHVHFPAKESGWRPYLDWEWEG